MKVEITMKIFFDSLTTEICITSSICHSIPIPDASSYATNLYIENYNWNNSILWFFTFILSVTIDFIFHYVQINNAKYSTMNFCSLCFIFVCEDVDKRSNIKKDPYVLVEIKGKNSNVALVQMNRPKTFNTLSRSLMNEVRRISNFHLSFSIFSSWVMFWNH